MVAIIPHTRLVQHLQMKLSNCYTEQLENFTHYVEICKQ